MEDLDHLLYYPIFVSLRRKFVFDILVQVIEADDVMKIKLKLCIRNNKYIMLTCTLWISNIRLLSNNLPRFS